MNNEKHNQCTRHGQARPHHNHHHQILEHWNIVVDVLQMQLMGATRMLQNALRLRTKQLKEQQAKRGVYSESQWTPLVQLDTPLFGKAPPAHSGPLSGGSAGAGGGIGAGAGAGPGVGAGSGMRGRPQRPGLPPQSGMRHHRTHHQHTTASIPPPPPPPATTGFRAQQAAPPAWPGASSTAGGGGGLRKRQGAYDQGIQTTSASSMQQAETMAAFPHIDRGAQHAPPSRMCMHQLTQLPPRALLLVHQVRLHSN